MVRVVWVTPYAPDRHGGGGQIRQAHLLLALARRAQVALVSAEPVADQAVRDASDQVVEVDVSSPSPRGAWERRARDLVGTWRGRHPLEVAALAPVRRALAPAVARRGADVLVAEYTALADLLPTAPVRRRVLTLHNLESRMNEHQAALMPHARQRWLFRRNAQVARRFELRAAAGADRVIVVSDADAVALGRPRHAALVPNGVDVSRFAPSPLPPVPTVVFTGALYTAPNSDGAAWLSREVFPLVRRHRPDARLLLVGAGPPLAVRELAALPGVELHADVPDTEPYLRVARVAAAAVRIGSGTRLKALEAMAAARPVVGTAVALEGLGVTDGRHALVADDAGGFAAAIGRLLDDDRLAGHLAAEGRAFVEERYSWSGIGHRFADVVLSTLDS